MGGIPPDVLTLKAITSDVEVLKVEDPNLLARTPVLDPPPEMTL